MAGPANTPVVIIKRKKVVAGGGHHGGAWKVAYADFVTAMMAFFMLMWLLNATTEKQRKGIADYFNPTIPVNRISGGGDGAFGGDSVFSETQLAQSGLGASQQRATAERQARGDTGTDSAGGDDRQAAQREQQALEKVAEQLSGAGGESMVTELMQRHIVTRLSDEGLIVELFDAPGAPLFDAGGVEPTETMRTLLPVIAQVFALVDNPVAIEGHTRSLPIVAVERPLWDVSIGRAEAVRRLLTEEGLSSDRVSRVAGHADTEPVTVNPLAERNNRIEMILLREVL